MIARRQRLMCIRDRFQEPLLQLGTVPVDHVRQVTVGIQDIALHVDHNQCGRFGPDGQREHKPDRGPLAIVQK